jgi:hypothetical protein
VLDADNKIVVDSMIFPFNFWWQKSCDAPAGDFEIAAIQKAWNVIIDHAERRQFLFTSEEPVQPDDHAQLLMQLLQQPSSAGHQGFG